MTSLMPGLRWSYFFIFKFELFVLRVASGKLILHEGQIINKGFKVMNGAEVCHCNFTQVTHSVNNNIPDAIITTAFIKWFLCFVLGARLSVCNVEGKNVVPVY